MTLSSVMLNWGPVCVISKKFLLLHAVSWKQMCSKNKLLNDTLSTQLSQPDKLQTLDPKDENSMRTFKQDFSLGWHILKCKEDLLVFLKERPWQCV